MKSPFWESRISATAALSFALCVLTFICGSVARRYHAGTNLVLLDPDVRKAFRSERGVNEALRLVIELRKVGSHKQA
jgi:hypothetical protein